MSNTETLASAIEKGDIITLPNNDLAGRRFRVTDSKPIPGGVQVALELVDDDREGDR